jgi:signal transduction histidine kinase
MLMADRPSSRRTREPTRARIFRLSVVVPVMTALAIAVYPHPRAFFRLELLYWALILTVIELFPIPAWRGLQLSLGFPIRLAVAMLYAPAVAAGVALVGTSDPREVRGERSPLPALFDRSQLALSVWAGSWVFHSMAQVRAPASPWFVLYPVVLLATTADYATNISIISLYMKVASDLKLREILGRLRLGSFSEFLLSYGGLSFVGAVIARLYLSVGIAAVAVFILPLIFARQMFFRTKALEEAHATLKDRERVLRALSNRMAEERHDERMQIAGYLHDDLAQMLFRLTLLVDMAKRRLARSDVQGVDRDLDQINTTKQEASDMVRALIRDLHRSPIGRAGLGEALTSFAQDAGARFKTPIIVDAHEPSLPPPIQLLIYQIAREAAMNALKHAEASTIWITLNGATDGVDLEIRDNGKGFDTDAAPPEGHFGSVMMRERALVAGGTFMLSSETGKGSSVRAHFPRVWVEEGSLHEQEEAARWTEATKAPVGTSTAAPANPLDAPLSARRGWHLARRRRARKLDATPREDPDGPDQAPAARDGLGAGSSAV